MGMGADWAIVRVRYVVLCIPSFCSLFANSAQPQEQDDGAGITETNKTCERNLDLWQVVPSSEKDQNVNWDDRFGALTTAHTLSSLEDTRHLSLANHNGLTGTTGKSPI